MKTRLLALVVSLCAGCKVYDASRLDSTTVAGGSASAGVSSAGSSGAAADSGAEQPGSTTAPEPAVDAGISMVSSNCTGGECWWSTAPADACKSAGVPKPSDRPDPNADGASSEPDIYLGWSRIWIGETSLAGVASQDAWQGFGLDLDGLCTNSADCMNARDSAQACHAMTAQVPFDGSLCRDNTFASLQPVAAAVPEIGKRFGIAESELNCNLWRGSYTMMLRLSGYNGQADDSDVRVDYYIGTGLTRPVTWQCPFDQYMDTYPLWRASWDWKVDSADLLGAITTPGSLPESRSADAHAYVRGGYLVATMPDDASMRLAADGTRYRGFAMKVQKALWTGKLYRTQDTLWHVGDGLFAGRVKGADLIQSFRQIGLCDGVGLDSIYQGVTDYITQNTDVLSDGSNAIERDCDAMSFGIAFEAAQLTPGPAGDAIPIVECCAPGVAIPDCDPKCGDGRLNGTEHCDTAIAAGQPGACPTVCAPQDSCTPTTLTGSGCDTQCLPMPITTIGAEDECCPKGADTTTDGDCAAVCGNDVIELQETCDPPESCASCVPADKCLKGAMTGSAGQCNVVCKLTPISDCSAGDGCCPANCGSDADCSTSCGDGTIDERETCETTGSALRCPTGCDDGDPCTDDVMTGSKAHCNVVCTHVPRTKPLDDDQCCPMGGTANNDNDCVAKCGNKKLEGDEQCDDGNTTAGDGCSAACKKESGVEQCLKLLDDRKPACSQCTCEKCQSQVLGCYANDDADANALCVDLVRCGLEHQCASDSCYCGDVGFANCAIGFANGLCRAEVEKAAYSNFAGEIVLLGSNPDYPVGRANQLGSCARTNCMTECGVE